MTTVIRNTRVIQTMEPVEVLEGVDVVIVDDRISKVGKNAAKDIKADKVIEGDGKTVVPGMICGHQIGRAHV